MNYIRNTTIRGQAYNIRNPSIHNIRLYVDDVEFKLKAICFRLFARRKQ